MPETTVPELKYVPNLVHTEKGLLRSISLGEVLGFLVQRFYWIDAVPPGASRGGHAHRNLKQGLIALRGSVTITLKTPRAVLPFELRSPDQVLMVPPGYWREMDSFSEDALLGVFASHNYDETDYIREWANYVKEFSSK